MQSTSAAAAGVLVHACGPGGGMPDAGPPVDSGLTVADVPMGVVACPDPNTFNFMVGHDAGGFYAYSNICTHEGCQIPCPGATANPNVGSTNSVSHCPCHSSAFSANGDVMGGPAPSSLNHYQVTFMGTGATAHIIVAPGTIVTDRTARATAP
jgi:Rieske Fe-S protein